MPEQGPPLLLLPSMTRTAMTWSPHPLPPCTIATTTTAKMNTPPVQPLMSADYHEAQVDERCNHACRENDVDANEKSASYCIFPHFLWRIRVERDWLRALRETLASQQHTILATKLQTSTLLPSSREAKFLSGLLIVIARALFGPVQELVEVFSMVKVGGRILPVQGDIRCRSLCNLS